jgi:hypothetical protein
MNPPVHPEDNDFDPDERPGEDNPPRDGADPSTPSPLGGGVRELDDIQLEALRGRVEEELLRRTPEERGAVAFAEVYTAADLDVRRRVSKAREAVRFVTAGLTTFVDRRDRKADIRQDGEPVVNHARERVEMTTRVRRGVFAGTYTVWAEVCPGGRFGVNRRTGFFRPAFDQFSGGSVTVAMEEMAYHLSLIER